MQPIFIAFITAAMAQTLIDYSGCANQDCTTTTNPSRGCSVYIARLPLTGTCTAGTNGLFYSAVAGTNTNTATVSVFTSTGCTGTAFNVNTNLPRTLAPPPPHPALPPPPPLIYTPALAIAPIEVTGIAGCQPATGWAGGAYASVSASSGAASTTMGLATAAIAAAVVIAATA